MIKIINFLFLVFFFGQTLFAQKKEPLYIDFETFNINKEGFAEARKNIEKGHLLFSKNTPAGYSNALKLYLKAQNYNPNDAELNYNIGVAYLESIQKKKSLKYLEKAYKLNPDVSQLISWDLGRSLHYNLMFKAAIVKYKQFKTLVSKLGIDTRKIDKKINECENGIRFAENFTDAEIITFSVINSEYPEYCPLISADESMMIFTARKLGSTGGMTDVNDGMYFEDIYVSYNNNGLWSKPKNIGIPLNTENHDATVGLSPDGQTLFLYRNEDIYTSQLKGDKWTEPKPLPSTINSSEVENSACISFDGNSIYFIRGKKADPEKSNSDIYLSKKVNGIWTKAKKLPKIINSKYDEDGVFMHPDGRTMFFSSKGHNSMGGFDIFKTTLQNDGTWSKPENLGFPVNTAGHDLYFVMAANGKHGYYSSIRSNGKGFMDIYKIDFPTEIGVNKDHHKIALLSIVKGTVKDKETGEFLESEIRIFDNDKDSLVLIAYSNSVTGKYLISLPSGINYGMSVKKDNYLFYSDNFNIPKGENYQEITKNILLQPIKKDKKVILRNIFFDTDKSVLRPESYSELNRLKKMLTENPTLKIEISGHTDTQGSYNHNIELSKSRAKAVVDYLISKGINANRLTSRGVSWDEPVSTNKTEVGRQLNRRVEFKITEK